MFRTIRRLLLVAALVGAAIGGGLIALPIVLEDGYSTGVPVVVLAGAVLAVVVQLANVVLLVVLRAGGFTGEALRAGLVVVPAAAVLLLVTTVVWESDGTFRPVWIAPVVVTAVAAWSLAPWCLAPLARTAPAGA